MYSVGIKLKGEMGRVGRENESMTLGEKTWGDGEELERREYREYIGSKHIILHVWILKYLIKVTFSYPVAPK